MLVAADRVAIRRPRPARVPRPSAISMTASAVPSIRQSQRASTGRPSGSWTAFVRHSQPPAAAIAVERALAAVRERREEDLVVVVAPGPSRRRGPRDLHRRERALERIGRDEDRAGVVAHRRSFQKKVVGERTPSVVREWFGHHPEGLPAEGVVHDLGVGAGLSVSRISSQRPSSRASYSIAVIRARPMPCRRASRWTRTLPISARWGAFGWVVRKSSVDPTMRPSGVTATSAVVVPFAIWAVRSRHQPAASSMVSAGDEIDPTRHRRPNRSTARRGPGSRPRIHQGRGARWSRRVRSPGRSDSPS